MFQRLRASTASRVQILGAIVFLTVVGGMASARAETSSIRLQVSAEAPTSLLGGGHDRTVSQG